MEITIYKNTVKEMFHELKADYDLEGSEYSMEDICMDIAKDFQDVWNRVKDLIEEKINEMVTNYMIDFKRKYDVMNSVDCMVFEMLERQGEQMKEELFEKWSELPEFEHHILEIEHLSNPSNVQKLLISPFGESKFINSLKEFEGKNIRFGRIV